MWFVHFEIVKSKLSTARGYVRPLGRLTASGQLTALKEHGIHRDQVYVEGEGPETLDELVRALRKGETVAVVRLHVLAPPKLRTADRPRRALWDAIKRIEEKGAHIFELDSGRRTSITAERDELIADAIEALTHAGRSPRRRDGAGRPPRAFTDEQIEQARTAWFDSRHRTNRDAITASPRGWSMTRSYKTFGPSGRDN